MTLGKWGGCVSALFSQCHFPTKPFSHLLFSHSAIFPPGHFPTEPLSHLVYFPLCHFPTWMFSHQSSFPPGRFPNNPFSHQAIFPPNNYPNRTIYHLLFSHHKKIFTAQFSLRSLSFRLSSSHFTNTLKIFTSNQHWRK